MASAALRALCDPLAAKPKRCNNLEPVDTFLNEPLDRSTCRAFPEGAEE